MKVFIVETKRGFVSIPEKIGNTRFPLTYFSEQDKTNATTFLTQCLAIKSMKKHKVSIFSIVKIHEVDFV